MANATVEVSLDEFREKLGCWLSGRHPDSLCDEATHARMIDSLIWLETHRRNGLDYVLRHGGAFSGFGRGEKEALYSQTSDQVLFLDAQGLPLVSVLPQVIAAARQRAGRQGMGLCVVEQVHDVITLAPVLEQVAQEGVAVFGSWAVDPQSVEGRILDGFLGSARAVVFVPRPDGSLLHMECLGPVHSHAQQMSGTLPQKLGDLVAEALLPTELRPCGVAVLCVDLPPLYEQIARALEAAAHHAPVRTFHDWEKSKNNAELVERGFILDELSWALVNRACSADEVG